MHNECILQLHWILNFETPNPPMPHSLIRLTGQGHLGEGVSVLAVASFIKSEDQKHWSSGKGPIIMPYLQPFPPLVSNFVRGKTVNEGFSGFGV